jgi:Tol biopolymer transport system component
VFAREAAVLAVPFDPIRGEVTGKEVVLEQGLEVGQGSFKTNVAVSANGTLAYLPRSSKIGTLRWVNRAGGHRLALDEHRSFTHPRLSPDGSRVAVGIFRESGEEEAWVYDLQRKTGWRIGTHSSLRPVWTADGKSLTLQKDGALITLPAEGGSPSPLLKQPGFLTFPLGWSPRGDTFLYSAVEAQTSRNVWSRAANNELRPVLNTTADERAAAFSPDGQWLAYAVVEPGAKEHVYIQPFTPSADPAGSRVVISKDGGWQPWWSPTGRELFYRSLDGRRLMAVDVQTAPTVRIGEPRMLFEGRYVDRSGGFYSDYDVTRDGKEFLMVVADDESTRVRLNVVVGTAK